MAMVTEENTKFSNDLDLTLKMAKEFGFELKPESVVMDFGCGRGEIVYELYKHGYQVFGCDIEFDSGLSANSRSLIEKGIIRQIPSDPYSLPFEDNSFDFIFSHQVFEHVKNYSEAISEIARVLKPEGLCIHILPSRYRPIEVHVFVPLASIIRTYWWLYFWALLGIRNEFQNHMKVKERTTMNYNYLEQKTNYLSRNSLQKHFYKHFNNVIFCEKEFLKFSPGGKYLFPLLKVLPFLPFIYSTFRTRVILARFPARTYTPVLVPN
jgi:SAM-dependent methyltransferase